MARLRTVSPRSRGWTRRRVGRGFTYLDEQGAKLPPEEESKRLLGNTPGVARSSYIDPRVIDNYLAGSTIADAARAGYASPDERQAALETAVLELLA